jgi:hypothetical protein
MKSEKTPLFMSSAFTTNFKWLVGTWFGTNEHMQSEMIWGAPYNGVMQGMYTIHESGTLRSSGRMQLSEENGVITLHFFTFDSNLKPLPALTEPASYTITELKENYAKFTSDFHHPFKIIEMIRIGNAFTSRYYDKKGVLGEQYKIDYMKV